MEIESKTEWNHDLVVSIREKRQLERENAPEIFGMLERVLDLVGNLYGEDVQYELELVQNADDEGATTMTFHFEEGALIVTNDGADRPSALAEPPRPRICRMKRRRSHPASLRSRFRPRW